MPEIAYSAPLWADPWLRPTTITPRPPRPLVLPVIHVPDSIGATFNNHRLWAQDFTRAQARFAFEAGADGVFLICHTPGHDARLPSLARRLKDRWPDKLVGVNMLYTNPIDAALALSSLRLDMLWCDGGLVDSSGTSEDGRTVKQIASRCGFTVFAGVAFKGQPTETRPADAAWKALEAGFVPTTSGERTGSPPALEKIQAMSGAAMGWLANASGMTVDNVAAYAPHLSHILVATGVDGGEADGGFSPELLRRFVEAAQVS